MTAAKSLTYFLGLVAVTSLGVNTVAAQDTPYTIGIKDSEVFDISIDGMTESQSLVGGVTLTKAGVGPGPDSITSICTDVNGTLFIGSTYNYAPPTVFSGHNGIDPTWGLGNGGPGTPNAVTSPANASAGIQAAADIFYKNSFVLNGTDPNLIAGLQLAIWTALYNTAVGSVPTTVSTVVPTTGNTPRFVVTGEDNLSGSGSWGSYSAGTTAAITDANAMLANVNPADQYFGSLLIPDPTVQFGLTGQEVLVNVTPIPETSTIIAGILLLLPFAVSTFRLGKNRAA